MKHINEYLLSKKKPFIKNEIMNFSTKEETKSFLDKMGYKEVDFIDNDNFRETVDSAKQPIYAFGPFRTDLDQWVRISKGGKENPIVFWRINNPKYLNLDILMYCVYEFNINYPTIDFDNFDDFKEYLEENSYF